MEKKLLKQGVKLKVIDTLQQSKSNSAQLKYNIINNNILNMKDEHILRLIYYFRMSKQTESHTKKNDSKAPLNMEEEATSSDYTSMTHQLEEAMEDEANMPSTGREREEDAGSDASSLCRLPIGLGREEDAGSYASSLSKLPKGGGTPMDIPLTFTMENQYPEFEYRHDEVVGSKATSHVNADLGEVVGSNTTKPIEPSETDVEVNLMEKLELESKEEKEVKRQDINLVYIPDDMDGAASPATSTPSSTPSPRRYREREGELEGLTVDSEMSDIVDSSVAETKEPENKRGANTDYLLDGNSKEGSKAQGTAELPGGKQTKKNKEKDRKEEPKSCISQRTRAKTGEKRKAEISAFKEEGDSFASSMRAEDGSLLAETLSFNEEGWLEEGKWIRTMDRLDETLEKIDAALEESEGVMKAVERIKEPEVVDITGDTVARRKKVTFKVDYEQNNLAMEEAMNLLEMMSKTGLENAPRSQVERIIRILVAICIDIYGRMQNAQRNISNTTSLLQEYMEKAEDIDEMRKNEDKLKEEIESLKRQRNEIEGFRNRLVEYMSDSTRAEAWNVCELKNDNNRLKNEIIEVEDKLRRKVGEYNMFFKKNGEKKARIEELENEIKIEKRQNRAEETRLRKRLEKECAKTELEKVKAEKERKARLSEATQKDDLIKERDDIKEELEETKNLWTNLKMELNEMDDEWEKVKKNLQKTAQELRVENSQLRDELSNKDIETNTEIQLREDRIKKLEHDMAIRAGSARNLRTDMENRQKEVNDLKKTIIEMSDEADKSEKKIRDLRKEIKEMKASEEREKAQKNTPVTIHEKSGTLLATQRKPLNRMIEEGESELSLSYMSAEEGASADIDSTFKIPKDKPKKVEKKKKSSRERAESSSDDSSQSGSNKRDRQGRRKDSGTSQDEEKDKVKSLKEELRRLKEEKEVRDREMEEMRMKNNELERTMTESIIGTPSKGKRSVTIIEITDENRDRVNIMLGGMLDNGNGTYSSTKMSETWKNNKEIQLINNYDSAPPRPDFLENFPEHPDPSTLNAEWSYKGEWREAPKEAKGTGEKGTDTRVARIERYIDYDGRIKRAICYGGKMGDLKIWFDFEEVKKVFPNWDTNKESVYYNNKTFTGTLKREYQEERKGKKPSGDQSKDIQEGASRGRGKRGGYSGGATGYSRGNHHNRGGGGKRREARDTEYQEWDEWQSAGVSRGGRSQDEMSDRSTYSEPQGRRKRDNSPGYTTKRFSEARRRNWSPDPERSNRRGRSQERYRDNRDLHTGPCYGGCDSRDYSSDRSERREPSPDRYRRREHSPRQRGRQERYGDRERKEYSTNEDRGYSGHR